MNAPFRQGLCERYSVAEHTVLGWIRSGELKAINVGREPAPENPAGGSPRKHSPRLNCYGRPYPPRNGHANANNQWM